jgi:hypothetical protein
LFLGAKSQLFCNEIDFVQVGEMGLMGNDLLMELLKEYRNAQTNRVEGFANLGELQSFVKRNQIKFEFEAMPKKPKKTKVEREGSGKKKKKKKGEKEREKKKRKTIEKFLERAVELGYGESTVAQLLEDVRGIGSEGLEEK